MTKLSIIIPAYNAEPYIDELVRVLFTQMTKEVEVLIIDDGSKVPYKAPYANFKVFRQDQNRGVSAARNIGLDNAKGEWVSFIDADDLVANDYIETILKTLEDDPDYVYLSWRTFGGGWDYSVELTDIEQKFPPFNLCVWNRIYRRSMIGEVRFNERKLIAEDAEFIRKVKEHGRKKAFIRKQLYFYRTNERGSLTERFNRGEIDFERIVYHLPHLPEDISSLVETVRNESESSEVIVMTYDKNEALEDACMVIAPQNIAGTELRGAYTSLFRQIPRPIKAQVVIYQGRIHGIGGVETWIYNFCKTFAETYDILIVYSNESSRDQIERLSELVPVMRNGEKIILCDTLLTMRITDKIPENIKARQIIQLCHLCQMKENYKIQPKHDLVVFPSEAARKSFADQTDGKVIQNITMGFSDEQKALILLTASRFTYEKGAERMKRLADAFRKNKIPFVWFVFTDGEIEAFPEMVRMKPTYDLVPYIKMADYVVQLSDRESFCYSLVEALENCTAIISTPLEILCEIGANNGATGYEIPFDGGISDELVQKMARDIPSFTYVRATKNTNAKKEWRKILGKPLPKRECIQTETVVQIISSYYDSVLHRMVYPGELIKMDADRADKIILSQIGKVANNAKMDML